MVTVVDWTVVVAAGGGVTGLSVVVVVVDDSWAMAEVAPIKSMVPSSSALVVAKGVNGEIDFVFIRNGEWSLWPLLTMGSNPTASYSFQRVIVVTRRVLIFKCAAARKLGKIGVFARRRF